MGIFKKKNSAAVSSGQLTILAKGSILKGALSVTGNMLVAGEVEGDLKCENTLSIGLTGRVRGTVQGRELCVSGLIEGDVHAEIVEIRASGKIQGTLQTHQLIIDRGGVFSGASITLSDTPQPPSLESSSPPIQRLTVEPDSTS